MRQETQAVVLAAGPGSRMTTVGFRAKSLLPVGNFPMLYYPLKFLQASGFDEATVIISQKDERETRKLIEVYGLEVRLDIVAVDTSHDPGTAESLRFIESKLKKTTDEVIILSSDLITDLSLSKMLNFHRSRGSGLTILTTNQNPDFTKVFPPGPKSKGNLNNDIICSEGGDKRLVYMVAGGDYDECINISNRIISTIDGGINMTTNLIDGHLYIMKRWIVDYIIHKESPCSSMGSLKSEVIPKVVSEQFWKVDEINTTNKCLRSFFMNDEFGGLIKKYNRSFADTRFHPDTKLDNCVSYAYNYSGFCVRVNSLGILWQVNRKINQICETLSMKSQKYEKGTVEGISDRAQICSETVIGRSTQVADKTNISNSVLGSHCRIGQFVRITNSLLFDNVHIAEGCIIENSMVCVSVENKCTLKNCILTDVNKTSANKMYENELLEKGMCQEYSY